MISDKSDPPVCKILDHGQFLYQQKKKEKANKKNVQVTKELKMSPKISIHDYNVRLRRATEFLDKKYKVKLTIFFRGREMSHQDLGFDLVKRFIEDIKESGVPDGDPIRQGRNIVLILIPN